MSADVCKSADGASSVGRNIFRSAATCLRVPTDETTVLTLSRTMTTIGLAPLLTQRRYLEPSLRTEAGLNSEAWNRDRRCHIPHLREQNRHLNFALHTRDARVCIQRVAGASVFFFFFRPNCEIHIRHLHPRLGRFH